MAEKPQPLEVGKKASLFTAKTAAGDRVACKEFMGQKVALFGVKPRVAEHAQRDHLEAVAI